MRPEKARQGRVDLPANQTQDALERLVVERQALREVASHGAEQRLAGVDQPRAAVARWTRYSVPRLSMLSPSR